MTTTPIKKRITSNTTTNVITSSCVIMQIVIACKTAGTAWTLQIQDETVPPFVLVPAFTLTVPTNGQPNVILKFNELPLPMDTGIDIITTGTTPGEVSVWMILGTN